MLFITLDGLIMWVSADGSPSLIVKNCSNDFKTLSENFSLYAFSITRQNSSCVGFSNPLIDLIAETKDSSLAGSSVVNTLISFSLYSETSLLFLPLLIIQPPMLMPISKPFSFKEKRLLPHRIRERSRGKSPRFARKRRAALLRAALLYLENHDNSVVSE